MNIEKIKYYIDLIDCQSFTETAKKNFVSQTTISQQIASLEKEFNQIFIDRKHTPIEPTPAGEKFYEESIIIWKQYESMKEKMSFFNEHSNPLLKIEYSALTDIKSLMKIIPSYKSDFPDAQIVLDKVPLKKISYLLLKEIYDIAIAFNSEFYDHPEIQTIPIYNGEYFAAVGENHPLYNENQINLETLYQFPLVMLDSKSIGQSYDLMIQKALEYGYKPKIKKTVFDIETELLVIRLDNLIGFVPDNFGIQDWTDGIRMIPIKKNHHTFKISIAYLKKRQNKSINMFIQSIKKVL